MNSFDQRRPYARPLVTWIKGGFGAPLLDNAQSKAQFAKRYRLLMIAFSHEVGNILHAFYELEMRFDANAPTCARLFPAFNRLRVLQNMETLNVDNAYLLRHFTTQEIAELGIGSVDGFNIIAIKEKVEIATKTVSESLVSLSSLMQRNISDLDTDLQARLHAAIGLGEMLVGKINALVQGSESDVNIIQLSVPAVSRKIRLLLDQNDSGMVGTVKCNGMEGVFINVDPELLTNIVQNILSNVRRSAREKGVEPAIDVTYYTRDGVCAFSFSDNGNGMSDEIMGKLNAGIHVTTKPADTLGEHGNGFWTSRNFAELMGGRLYVKESQVGIGSVIVLELKIAGVADV